MPWWAIIYLVLFVGFSLVADALSIRDDGPRLRHICDCAAGLTFAVLFVGFWLPSVRGTLGLLAPVLFVAALVWEVYSSPRDLREIWRDDELSKTERIGLLVLPPLLAWPLYVVAGIGVFRYARA